MDEKFKRLSYVEMERRLKKEISIPHQTIKRWIEKLADKDYIYLDTCCYNYYCTGRNHKGELTTWPITKEQHLETWKCYLGRSYCEAANSMYGVTNGMPHKNRKVWENAFYHKELNILREILREEYGIKEKNKKTKGTLGIRKCKIL